MRLEAVFREGWEAFKLPVPPGLIQTDQRTLTYRAKAGTGVHGVEVRLGLGDGSWWRARHGVAPDWQDCILRDREFQCCHPPDAGSAPDSPCLADIRWLQFQPLLAGQPGTYMVWLDTIRTTRYAMKPAAHVPFRPLGKNAWDFWFAQDGETTHAFYLEYPDAAALPDQSKRHGHQWIGHALSTDLWHWRELPPALEPGTGAWQTTGLATGSVVRDGDDWYMLHTCSGMDRSGLALAHSHDLTTWEKLGDGPVIRGGTTFAFPWDDGTIHLRPLADPYLFPEQQDGWWLMICNSHVVGAPENERAATGMWRSRDLRTWEPYRVIAWPRDFERMETSQIWEHGGRWYLYFGGVHTNSGNANYVFLADRMEGPYTAQPWSRLELPGGAYFYIGKRLLRPDGREVFLAGQSYSSLSAPYPLIYAGDGSMRLGDPGVAPVDSRIESLLRSTPGPATTERPRHTEGSLLVRRDGSYLLAYTRFNGGAQDDAKADIVGTISRDRGATWGEPYVIQANDGGCNVMSASLLRLADGGVLLAYIRKDSHQSCTVLVRRSEDDGTTFGAPLQVNDWQAYMAVVNDSLLQLGTGRILCPIYYSRGPCWTPQEHYLARMAFSDDGGRSWQTSRTDVDCPRRGAMEPVVLERLDGSLLMLVRTQMGCVYQSISQDGGETWSPATPSPLPSQEAPIAVRRIPGTELAVAVWNAAFQADAKSHGGRRSPLHIAVSRDDFATPVRPLPLAASAAQTFSYPSLAFDQERLVLTYYEEQSQLSLRFDALLLPALLGNR